MPYNEENVPRQAWGSPKSRSEKRSVRTNLNCEGTSICIGTCRQEEALLVCVLFGGALFGGFFGCLPRSGTVDSRRTWKI